MKSRRSPTGRAGRANPERADSPSPSPSRSRSRSRVRTAAASNASPQAKEAAVAPTSVHTKEETPASTVNTPVSHWKSAIEMIVCVVSIYTCYIGHGIFHEKITKHPYGVGENKEKFTHTGFFTMTQCFGNLLWALLLLLIEGFRRASQPQHAHNGGAWGNFTKLIFDKVPKTDYAIVAFSYSLAMYSSTAALKFVSYPVQALAKSSKLIPVMVGRILIGCKYTLREYFHVLCITGGIALYFLFDHDAAAAAAKAAMHQPVSESAIEEFFGGTVFGMHARTFFGIALLSLSLIMDAVTGPKQESVSKRYNPHVMTMAFWINLFPAIVMLGLEVNSGAFASALAFIARHPEIRFDFVASCLCSAIGQSVILWGLFKFNSMTITIITTIRKFFTILASVFWFNNQLNFYQWCAVILVFLGVGLDTQFKFTRRSKGHGHGHGHSHGEHPQQQEQSNVDHSKKKQ